MMNLVKTTVALGKNFRKGFIDGYIKVASNPDNIRTNANLAFTSLCVCTGLIIFGKVCEIDCKRKMKELEESEKRVNDICEEIREKAKAWGKLD